MHYSVDAAKHNVSVAISDLNQKIQISNNIGDKNKLRGLKKDVRKAEKALKQIDGPDGRRYAIYYGHFYGKGKR